MFKQIACAWDGRVYALDDQGKIWYFEKDAKSYNDGIHGQRMIWKEIPLPNAKPEKSVQEMIAEALAEVKNPKKYGEAKEEKKHDAA